MSSNKEKKDIVVAPKTEIDRKDGEPTKEGVFYSPNVDIYETEDSYTLLADLPGVEKDQLDIHVEDKKLTITGLVPPGADQRAVYTEYGIGGYTRSFRLGDAIDQSKIEASLVDGVLTLVLAKAEQLKPRKISITTG